MIEIRDVRLIDGRAEAARPGVDIRVEGDRIVAITPTGAAGPASAAIRRGS